MDDVDLWTMGRDSWLRGIEHFAQIMSGDCVMVFFGTGPHAALPGAPQFHL